MTAQANPVDAGVAASPLPALDTALVARARHLRQQSKRTLVEELEALSGMEPRLVVQALAQPFGMTVLETVDMLAFVPAFDLRAFRLLAQMARARHQRGVERRHGGSGGAAIDEIGLGRHDMSPARSKIGM